jgi:hypothetical protein
VARIDREAAPDVRRVIDVFVAEQLLVVVALSRRSAGMGALGQAADGVAVWMTCG